MWDAPAVQVVFCVGDFPVATADVGPERRQMNKQRVTGYYRFLGLLAAQAAAGSGCSDANLICVDAASCGALIGVPAEPQGLVCTADPRTIVYDYKVLFVVDTSGSNKDSDPDNNRGPAVRQAVANLLIHEEFSFALLAFSDVPQPLISRFTRDENVLAAQLPQLALKVGGTNYLDTLNKTAELIHADAMLLTAEKRQRTRYDIQWLSDGRPEFQGQCPPLDEVLASEQAILNLMKSDGIYSIKLSTNFLTGALPNNTVSCIDAKAYLVPMARTGRGKFREFDGTSINFEVPFSSIVTPFSSKEFYFVNESRTVTNGVLQPDSDRDGISDADERIRGSDPTLPMATESACLDAVDVATAPNVGLCSSQCPASERAIDSDGDGINDCSEQVLGSRSLRADSDGDSLIDSLELRFHTNLNDATTVTADTDLDGISDRDEIKQGTDPMSVEPNRDLAYSYAALKLTESDTEGMSCYTFQVNNVRLAATTATATSKAGDNLLCLYMVQYAVGTNSASAEPTVSRACKWARFESNVPIDLPSFVAADFYPILCPVGTCKLADQGLQPWQMQH